MDTYTQKNLHTVDDDTFMIQKINEDQARKFARNRWFILGAIAAICVFAITDIIGGVYSVSEVLVHRGLGMITPLFVAYYFTFKTDIWVKYWQFISLGVVTFCAINDAILLSTDMIARGTDFYISGLYYWTLASMLLGRIPIKVLASFLLSLVVIYDIHFISSGIISIYPGMLTLLIKMNINIIVFMLISLMIMYYLQKNVLENYLIQREIETENTIIENQNREILRQQAILTEQSVEIETTNTRLHEAIHKLEMTLQEKNEFMGVVAHDLKNPLGTILMLSKYIHKDDTISESTRDAVNDIVITANGMFELIKALLEFNIYDSGSFVMKTKVINFSENIHHVIKRYTLHAQKKNMTIHTSLDDSLRIMGDAIILQGIVDNLVSNALKYSHLGAEIIVTLQRSQDKCRFEVIDQGPGISPEEMKKLFKKFQKLSARPTGDEHSSGLGLASTKKFVELHNGTIWCESVIGRGSTFIVEIPLADTSSVE
ncbi:MAG TPA: HAMP domain-containing sensor histidine kinase [Candidatus Kapabacteria bacterium]|mgnify:CR=1 FL=1|nr:HAMP domain-containing histidine kinase [Ignavibacteria bacterium]HRK59852.1 HAMP domain-containing sensor histidine kinase [Candidatus Kapabacteria bacterium]